MTTQNIVSSDQQLLTSGYNSSSILSKLISKLQDTWWVDMWLFYEMWYSWVRQETPNITCYHTIDQNVAVLGSNQTVVYFNRISAAVWSALTQNFVKSGAHIHYVNSWILNTFTIHSPTLNRSSATALQTRQCNRDTQLEQCFIWTATRRFHFLPW